MIVTPDFSEMVDFDSPVPTGVYKARIAKCEQKTSKKGETYLNWSLSLFGGEGEASKFNGRNVYMMTMLKGPGAGKLWDLYKAAVGAKPEGQIDTEGLLGKEVQVVTQLAPDMNGKDRTEVKFVKSLQ